MKSVHLNNKDALIIRTHQNDHMMGFMQSLTTGKRVLTEGNTLQAGNLPPGFKLLACDKRAETGGKQDNLPVLCRTFVALAVC